MSLIIMDSHYDFADFAGGIDGEHQLSLAHHSQLAHQTKLREPGPHTLLKPPPPTRPSGWETYLPAARRPPPRSRGGNTYLAPPRLLQEGKRIYQRTESPHYPRPRT